MGALEPDHGLGLACALGHGVGVVADVALGVVGESGNAGSLNG